MLITFKSKAAADIVMYKEHAQRILDLLGKNIDQGIITHADSQKAILTIEKAMADSKAHPASDLVKHDINNHPQPYAVGDHDHEKVEAVGFSARAFPLLQMIKAANQEGCDVVWGV